jgi:hypothetical protein
MVATYSANKALFRSRRRLIDYDIDASLNVVDLGMPQGAGLKCVPLAAHRRYLAGLFRSVGTGTVDAFNIFVCTAADGTGSPTSVVTHAIGSAPDAVGDTIWLEVDAEQCREVLSTAAFVGVRVDLATSTDECVVYFEELEPFFVGNLPTADFIS